MTTMFTALMFVSIFVNTVPSVSSTNYACCPQCNLESIEPLPDVQLHEIVSQRSVIAAIEQDPQLLYNASYQRSFVTLTPQQNSQILRNFQEIFRNQSSFLNSSSTVGTVSQSPTGDGIRARRSALSQICPSKFGSKPLIIALTPPDGDVVELVQMRDANQWILEETCKYQRDQTLTELSCCLVERHVRGLFINLSAISQGKPGNHFDFSDIIVQSCASFRT